jgi:hypothetical protein
MNLIDRTEQKNQLDLSTQRSFDVRIARDAETIGRSPHPTQIDRAGGKLLGVAEIGGERQWIGRT